MTTESTAPLLTVDDLKVSFATEDGVVRAVDGVSFTVDPGEVVAIVGESGSGKSVTAMTLLGLTRGPNSKFEGTATFDGTELINASPKQLQRIRGAGIAMVFQEPLTALDPLTQEVTVAAGGQRRVDWRVKVVHEGEAVVRMKAVSDEDADAVQMRFPCFVHGLLKTESFTGVIRPDKDLGKIVFSVPARIHCFTVA